MRLLWEDRAWEDYLYWQMQDKKTLKRINALIKDIARNAFDGIDDVNRIIYYEENGIVFIVSCRGHYDDT